jgi:hypothetical protein
MFEQSRETLPVAFSKLERRIQNEEAIAGEITKSLENNQGMPPSLRKELEDELAVTHRNIGRHVTEIALIY